MGDPRPQINFLGPHLREVASVQRTQKPRRVELSYGIDDLSRFRVIEKPILRTIVLNPRSTSEAELFVSRLRGFADLHKLWPNFLIVRSAPSPQSRVSDPP